MNITELVYLGTKFWRPGNTEEVARCGGSDGVIVAKGGVAGGYTLFVQQGKPRFEYNWYSQERYKIVSSASVVPGKNVVKLDFKYDGGGIAKGGIATLYLNDKKVGEGRIEKTEPAGRFSADETFDTGFDSASPVSADYKSPFPFLGTVNKVVIDIVPANLSQADKKRLDVAAIQALMARE
jgi:arylsulfatase